MKQGCLTWEEYRGIVQASRGEVKQARVQMELNLVRNVKGNKKCFCKYIGDKENEGKCGPIAEQVRGRALHKAGKRLRY